VSAALWQTWKPTAADIFELRVFLQVIIALKFQAELRDDYLANCRG